jgi:hypothetical protein
LVSAGLFGSPGSKGPSQLPSSSMFRKIPCSFATIGAHSHGQQGRFSDE